MNKYGVPTTIDEVLELGQKELSAFEIKDLRRIVGVLVSAGNKRLRNLEKRRDEKGLDMYAYEATMSTGGYFSVLDSTGKPKSRNALYHEILRARNFLNSRTSTVKGAMEERKRKERSFFGETREERDKRLKHKQAFEKKNEERIAEGKKPLKYRETKLDKARQAYEERQRMGNEPPLPDDYEESTYDPAKAISNTFVLYRAFEKFHPDILGFMGSDSVIEYMGSVSNKYNGENLTQLIEQAAEKLKNDVLNPRGLFDEDEGPEPVPDFWEDYFKQHPDRLDYLNNQRAAEEAEELAREAELARKVNSKRKKG